VCLYVREGESAHARERERERDANRNGAREASRRRQERRKRGCVTAKLGTRVTQQSSVLESDCRD